MCSFVGLLGREKSFDLTIGCGTVSGLVDTFEGDSFLKQ